MVKINTSLKVNVPIEKLWHEFVVLIKRELNVERIFKGQKFSKTTQARGRQWTTNHTITAVEPEKEYSTEIINNGDTYTTRYTFEKIDDQNTLVTYFESLVRNKKMAATNDWMVIIFSKRKRKKRFKKLFQTIEYVIDQQRDYDEYARGLVTEKVIKKQSQLNYERTIEVEDEK